MSLTENDILQSLYYRYYSAALLYTTAMCGDVELARDIVADAFVKAYLSLPEETTSFQYWLFRVCKNLWIDHMRKRITLVSEDEIRSLSDHTTPETLYFEKERNRALWNAIKTLAPVDREIITLHYFSGLSLQEIANLMGKGYPAIRQRISRLRQTLKRRMEEQGYDF